MLFVLFERDRTLPSEYNVTTDITPVVGRTMGIHLCVGGDEGEDHIAQQ